MKLRAIKVGNTYETTVGIGLCVRAGGTFPPSVQIDIVRPFPRGVLTLSPRNILREVELPASSK